MNLQTALIESWKRNAQMVENLLGLYDATLLQARTDPDGWTAEAHFAHIHSVRMYWLRIASGQSFEGVRRLTDENWELKPDMDLRAALAESRDAVEGWLAANLDRTDRAENYDHPALYLQHMLWHEGWHFGLLTLILRLQGHEPSEEWECAHVWDLWRLPD
jgi:uncharacterized damage-inducible protein DinB